MQLVELKEDKKIKLSEIGGKAQGLQKLFLSSFNVPRAVCVPVNVFDFYIRKSGLTKQINAILNALNDNCLERALTIARVVRDQLSEIDLDKNFLAEIEKLPEYSAGYAVRSSSVTEDGQLFSWAGVFESDLFVKKQDIAKSIVKCWLSLFSDRAVYYMYKSGCTILFPKMAVVIQKMVSSHVSGVLFTQDILTGDTDTMLLEWCTGVGEKLVSGEVTPHMLRVNKSAVEKSENFIEKTMPFDAGVMVLFLKDVLKLSEKMNAPLDIEWAYENEQIYVVQCRPITATSQAMFGDDIYCNDDKYHLHLSRNMSLFHTRLMMEGHYCKSELFFLKKGISFLAVIHKGMYTQLYVRSQDEKDYIDALIPQVLSDETFVQMQRQYKKLGQVLVRASKKCYRHLNINNFLELCQAYSAYSAGLSLTILAGQFLNKKLSLFLENNNCGDLHPNKALSILTAVKSYSPAMTARLELYRTGALLQRNIALDTEALSRKWVKKYRHIPVNFCENPWTTEDYEKMLAEYLMVDCAQKITELKSEKKQRLRLQKELLDQIENPEILLIVKRLQALTELNEHRKEIFCKTTFYLQKIFQVIARQKGLASWKILYNLLPAEIASIIQNEDIVILHRNVAVLSVSRNTVQELDIHSLKRISAETVCDEKNRIVGMGISGCKIKGTVRLIAGSGEFSKMQPGDIIVTKMTSVDFVPLFEKAAGIITDEGGVTCHAAVISRELNKTCVIGTKVATSVLKDGDIVLIDGENGVIERVSNDA